MKPTTLLRLYPRAWRERYGDEVLALIEQSGGGWRCAANLVLGAGREWVHAAAGDTWAGPFAAGVVVAAAELIVAVSALVALFIAFSAAGLAVQWASHALPPEWRMPQASSLAVVFADVWSNAIVLIGYGAVLSLPVSLVARRFLVGVPRAVSVLAAFACMAFVVRALGGPFEIALGGGFFLWRMAYRAHLPGGFDHQRATA